LATDKSSDSYAVQASPMVGSTMVNIRGNTSAEFFTNLAEVADHAGDLVDGLAVITAAANASEVLTPRPAEPSAGPTQANWQPPATGASSPSGDAPTCAHGPRSFKTTKTGKKLWECPLAVANWKDPNACKATWVN
jgi:hypothetical protein